jgi:hypothetical protein
MGISQDNEQAAKMNARCSTSGEASRTAVRHTSSPQYQQSQSGMQDESVISRVLHGPAHLSAYQPNIGMWKLLANSCLLTLMVLSIRYVTLDLHLPSPNQDTGTSLGQHNMSIYVQLPIPEESKYTEYSLSVNVNARVLVPQIQIDDLDPAKVTGAAPPKLKQSMIKKMNAHGELELEIAGVSLNDSDENEKAEQKQQTSSLHKHKVRTARVSSLRRRRENLDIDDQKQKQDTAEIQFLLSLLGDDDEQDTDAVGNSTSAKSLTFISLQSDSDDEMKPLPASQTRFYDYRYTHDHDHDFHYEEVLGLQRRSRRSARPGS